jgi:ankyrin repeat protein
MKRKFFTGVTVLGAVSLLGLVLWNSFLRNDSGRTPDVEAGHVSIASFARSKPAPLSRREKARKKLDWLSVTPSAESLFAAAADKQYYTVGLLLTAGVELNATDAKGRTPLLIAIESRDSKMVDFFLNAGADVNIVDNGYPPPLEVALSQGDLPLMKILIDLGADVNATDRSGKSLLLKAVTSKNSDALQLMLKSGAILKASREEADILLQNALKDGQSAIAETLFASEGALRTEWTPFMRETFAKALRTSDRNIAALLVAHHSQFPKPCGATQSLLAYSLAWNDLHSFKTLLDLGADPNESLIIPAEQGFIDAVKDTKLEFYLRNEEGMNLLMLAAGLGRLEFVRALLDKGADRNARTAKYKMVPLSFAQQNNRTPVILLLLGKNPDPTTQTTRVAISLSAQRAVFYKNGVPVLRTPVSTGRKDYPTPSGEFVVTDKQRVRVSSIYDVEMPYFMRLNGSAVGMHAGHVPGYPASHGCIRLPTAAARKLFSEVEVGTYVKITE